MTGKYRGLKTHSTPEDRAALAARLKELGCTEIQVRSHLAHYTPKPVLPAKKPAKRAYATKRKPPPDSDRGKRKMRQWISSAATMRTGPTVQKNDSGSWDVIGHGQVLATGLTNAQAWAWIDKYERR